MREIQDIPQDELDSFRSERKSNDLDMFEDIEPESLSKRATSERFSTGRTTGLGRRSTGGRRSIGTHIERSSYKRIPGSCNTGVPRTTRLDTGAPVTAGAAALLRRTDHNEDGSKILENTQDEMVMFEHEINTQGSSRRGRRTNTQLSLVCEGDSLVGARTDALESFQNERVASKNCATGPCDAPVAAGEPSRRGGQSATSHEPKLHLATTGADSTAGKTNKVEQSRCNSQSASAETALGSIHFDDAGGGHLAADPALKLDDAVLAMNPQAPSMPRLDGVSRRCSLHQARSQKTHIKGSTAMNPKASHSTSEYEGSCADDKQSKPNTPSPKTSAQFSIASEGDSPAGMCSASAVADPTQGSFAEIHVDDAKEDRLAADPVLVLDDSVLGTMPQALDVEFTADKAKTFVGRKWNFKSVKALRESSRVKYDSQSTAESIETSGSKSSSKQSTCASMDDIFASHDNLAADPPLALDGTVLAMKPQAPSMPKLAKSAASLEDELSPKPPFHVPSLPKAPNPHRAIRPMMPGVRNSSEATL